MSYIPSTVSERKEMLDALGLKSVSDLYKSVPAKLKNKAKFEHLAKEGLSEFEVKQRISEIAGKNKAYKVILRGAGAYSHFIPSVVNHLATRSEFVTAYTPYQPEMSQGILQGIFEWQTTICSLTGLDVSNASMYDGATAAAEATSMCVEKTRRTVIVSKAVSPNTFEVLKTYAKALDINIIECAEDGGKTSLANLKKLANAETACVYVETPNYYGQIEDAEAIAEAIHTCGGKLIVGVNPTSLAVLKTPSEYGADIAVGSAQPLGIPLAFGGPYAGFMACKKELIRRIPGRIVGQTVDKEGKRAFVLTLQAREQHIRREKALSNICTNAAHSALTACIYCAAMGPAGLEEVALQSMASAAYLKEQLASIGFKAVHKGDMFHEFITECPVETKKLLAALDKKGILGGLELPNNRILWCATEVCSKAVIDECIAVIKAIVKEAK